MSIWLVNDHYLEKDSAAIEDYYSNSIRIPSNFMDGLFTVEDKKCRKLKPIYWEKEKPTWLLKRGDFVCKIPLSPPSLYFMNIKPDINMKSYYQPVSDVTSAKQDYSQFDFPSLEKKKDELHIIFVIHGIGHHEGEEGIVENANDIREGFIKYIKKFHPELSIPLVIPIAWRYNLEMDDKRISASQSLKFEMAEKLGIILNEPFYYSAEYKNDIKNKLIVDLNMKFEKVKMNIPQVTPKVSFLAHSLGSVIAFDILNDKYLINEKKLQLVESMKVLNFDVENLFLIGSPLARFLINIKFDVQTLKENPWVKNGRIFNIMNLDDPVVHRFETLFDPLYEYVQPVALCLRTSNETTLELKLCDQYNFTKFHEKLTNNRELSQTYHLFYQIDYSKKDNGTTKAKNNLLPPAIRKKFIETKVASCVPVEIENNERILNRFDYNLFHTKYRPNIINFETYSFAWAKKLARSHSSYWKNMGTVALMTNIINNYGKLNDEAKIKISTMNFNVYDYISAVLLAICRFLCTIYLIAHAEPLLLVDERYEEYFLYFFYMGEKSEKNHKLVRAFLCYLLVIPFLMDILKSKLPSIYRYNLYFFAVMYVLGFYISFLIEKTFEFHLILYNYFLILLSIKLPNVKKACWTCMGYL